MSTRRVIALATVLLVCAFAPEVRADQLDLRAHQLRTDGKYKVRLSAALWLSRQRDSRAVAAMAHALRHDSERTVRSMAAVSLGKMVDESVPVRMRDLAIDALDHAAHNDKHGEVRRKARDSYRSLAPLRTRRSRLPAVFVAVGSPVTTARAMPHSALPKVQVMVRRSLRSRAPELAQGIASDGLPTGAELNRRGTRGFYVTATVAELQIVRRQGGRVEVSCAVTLRVNPWSGSDGHERMRRDDSAAASGRGKVIGAGSKGGIARARLDCVEAVVDEVVGQQVVPFIKRRSGRRLAAESTR